MARILGKAVDKVVGLERGNIHSLVMKEGLKIAGSEVVITEGI